MKLIVDSNVILSALIKDSKTREIIFMPGFEFLHPKIALRNMDKHKDEIRSKADISVDEYEELFNLLFEKILLIDEKDFLNKLDEAREIIGHIDIEDVPFVALALSISNDGIWSDDKHFEKQNKVKLWKTGDVIKITEKLGI